VTTPSDPPAADGDRGAIPTWWIPATDSDDVHAAFRARWRTEGTGVVEVRVLAASRFRLWVDGELVGDGPVRFPPEHPRCQRWQLQLPPGDHVLAVHVHAFGTQTRMLADLPGFVWADIRDPEGHPATLTWRCRRLTEYRQTGRRTSPLYGPLEWAEPLDDWTQPAADDADWSVPAPADIRLGHVDVLPAERPLLTMTTPSRIGAGTFVDRFTGYEFDDPALQFAVARLRAPDTPSDQEPADGVWARYDLGRTRLGTPRVSIESATGATVVIGAADQLTDGRVVPIVPLSTGPTAFVSRFTVPSGRHTVEPLSPIGARFLEVRAYGDQPTISDVTYRSHERLGDPPARLRTGDDQLDRIWLVGVETLRACADDTLVDTPTRERGQWLGDVSACGVELEATGYGAAAHARRSLLMAADCVDGDGLVPGLFPGDRARVSTFAAQWVSACLRYVELTGDLSLVDRVVPAAESTLTYLTTRIGDDGDTSALPWAFVDWGYEPAGLDLATLLIIRRAVSDQLRMLALLGRPGVDRWAAQRDRITTVVRRHWEQAGYHAAALALRDGLLTELPDAVPAATADLVHRHLTECFPYDPGGFRQRDPATVSARIATPYFANTALAALLQVGRTDAVLDIYRRCWGWMLDRGATTWWEVFDPRWSRCHLWSSAPTWQLTRHLLGWQPRFDLGPGHVFLRPVGGATELSRLDGLVALPDGQNVAITVDRAGGGAAYRLESPVPLTLHLPDGREHPIAADRPGSVTVTMLN